MLSCDSSYFIMLIINRDYCLVVFMPYSVPNKDSLNSFHAFIFDSQFLCVKKYSPELFKQLVTF